MDNMPKTGMPLGALPMLILCVLQSGSLHGHALAQRIQVLSSGSAGRGGGTACQRDAAGSRFGREAGTGGLRIRRDGVDPAQSGPTGPKIPICPPPASAQPHIPTPLPPGHSCDLRGLTASFQRA